MSEGSGFVPNSEEKFKLSRRDTFRQILVAAGAAAIGSQVGRHIGETEGERQGVEKGIDEARETVALTVPFNDLLHILPHTLDRLKETQINMASLLEREGSELEAFVVFKVMEDYGYLLAKFEVHESSFKRLTNKRTNPAYTTDLINALSKTIFFMEGQGVPTLFKGYKENQYLDLTDISRVFDNFQKALKEFREFEKNLNKLREKCIVRI